MEELKLLISMVNDLPALATWVLVGYLIYKITVIGSIYGVIRLLIVKMHDVLMDRKTMAKPGEIPCIDETVHAALIMQINRLKTTIYIHNSDVQNLAYKISLGNQDHLGVPRESEWYATDRNGACGLANHPNISVMRCLVMKFYGNEIEENLL